MVQATLKVAKEPLEQLPLTLTITMTLAEWKAVKENFSGYSTSMAVHLFVSAVGRAVDAVAAAVDKTVDGDDV